MLPGQPLERVELWVFKPAELSPQFPSKLSQIIFSINPTISQAFYSAQ